MFHKNIERETLKNTYYRKVLNTTKEQQLVVMSLNVGENIPEEIHIDTTQFFRIESGVGYIIIKNKKYKLSDGISVIVPANTKHYLVNTSNKDPLKLYTIYSPPHHKPNKIDRRQKE